MAYLKILKIRSEQGIENAANYISDESKTALDSSRLSVREGVEVGSDHMDIDAAISALTSYTANPLKTDSSHLVTGINCTAKNAARQMRDLSSYWKTRRRIHGVSRDAFHIIQSVNPKDNGRITPETVHEMGVKFASSLQQMDDKKEVNRRYMMLVTTHIDKEHIHNHIVLCSYDIDTGRKFHECREVYRQMRETSDSLCRQYGISVIENPDLDRKYSRGEYRHAEDGSSWKERIRRDIEAVSSVSSDWDTYTGRMQVLGYELREGKYVTYKDSEGRKVRDRTLGREWTKEVLEENWSRQQSIQKGRIPQDDSSEQLFTVLVSKHPGSRFLDAEEEKSSSSVSISRVGLFDENGRRRSTLEILLLTAIDILMEGNSWGTDGIFYRQYYDQGKAAEERERGCALIAEAVEIAKEEGIRTEKELSERLQQVGADLSHFRLELKKNRITKNKMDIIRDAVDLLAPVRDTVEGILLMEDGTQKEELLAQYAEEAAVYKKAMAVLYRYQCSTREQIEDFRLRFCKVTANISEMAEKTRSLGARYSRLKKIQKAVRLAESEMLFEGRHFDKEWKNVKDTAAEDTNEKPHVFREEGL